MPAYNFELFKTNFIAQGLGRKIFCMRENKKSPKEGILFFNRFIQLNLAGYNTQRLSVL